MPTMAFEQTPAVIVASMGRTAPSDADWSAFMGAIAAGLVAGKPAAALVRSEGGAPSPAQRSQLEKVTAPVAGQLKVAILTESTFVRGVVNSMALFNRGYRAFAPTHLDDALAYLDIRPARAAEIQASLARLRLDLGR